MPKRIVEKPGKYLLSNGQYADAYFQPNGDLQLKLTIDELFALFNVKKEQYREIWITYPYPFDEKTIKKYGNPYAEIKLIKA